jgi:hypothetical protein
MLVRQAPDREQETMNQMGTKLICDECQAQVIVTKTGEGTVTCHGVPMRPAGSPRPAEAAQNGSGRE